MSHSSRKHPLRVRMEQELKQRLAAYERFLQEHPEPETWSGKEFSFIIRRVEGYEFGSDFEISHEDYDRIMTPNSFHCEKDGEDYVVGEDRFNYSWEMSGIAMVFNDEIPYTKARKIADEVKSHLEHYTGQKAEIVIMNTHNPRPQAFF